MYDTGTSTRTILSGCDNHVVIVHFKAHCNVPLRVNSSTVLSQHISGSGRAF